MWSHRMNSPLLQSVLRWVSLYIMCDVFIPNLHDVLQDDTPTFFSDDFGFGGKHAYSSIQGNNNRDVGVVNRRDCMTGTPLQQTDICHSKVHDYLCSGVADCIVPVCVPDTQFMKSRDESEMFLSLPLLRIAAKLSVICD